MHGATLEVRSLTRSFGHAVALQGMTFSVPKNSVCAFIGANGAGKTTTFSIIAGFLAPSGGEVLVDGESVAAGRRRGVIVGLLPQDMQFFEHRSVARQLYLFARLSGCGRGESWDEVERVLRLVHLFSEGHKRYDQLSHGMRVRLSIAQALIGNPALILLDEPTAGLDPRMVQAVKEIIASLRGSTTLVVSSHDLAQLEEMSDYVVMVDKGRVVREGPLGAVMGSEEVQFKVGKGLMPAELQSAFPQWRFAFPDALHFAVKVEGGATISEVTGKVTSWIVGKGIEIIKIDTQRKLQEAYLEATER